MDTEGQWSAALGSNNIRVIIHWLKKLTAEDEGDVEEILQTFSCWVQRTSEFAKKELLTLCFSRCNGLWMFLDHSSFTRFHMLLQRLRNLLTLAQWARRQLSSAHLWHGVGVPCIVCRDTFDSSGCWNREHRALKQHIWLGRLVQWWGIMGLLPKYPEAHEVKRITQMWKEMDQTLRKACPETPGCKEGEKENFEMLIQGMVTQLDRQHGCIWISEDCTAQCYPPPNLQALLKLVLVPHIDNMSVQALLMYFVLDIANFLQCRDDLLRSFCKAFTIPSTFSQQIRAFWMLDHGHVKASMELLLSPRAAVPEFPWQHRCIIHCLLKRKQLLLALQYLHWSRPPIQSVEDAKLCANVLLQNSCVSDAWTLLRRSHTEKDNMVIYFLQACSGLGLSADALKYIPEGYNDDEDDVKEIRATESQLLIKTGGVPCPFSAELYQAQRVNPVSLQELTQLVRKAVMGVRKPYPRISEVLWPEHTERKSNSNEKSFSTEALHHLTPISSSVDMLEETEQTAPTVESGEEQKVPELPPDISLPMHLCSESVSSFASSPPPLSWNHRYVYKSTLTLQRISSLLTDGETRSGDEGDEEEEERDNRTPSPVVASPDCPKVIVTLDGATEPIHLFSFGEVTLSSGGDDDHSDVLKTDSVSGSFMNEDASLKTRNECSHSLLNFPAPLIEISIVPSPDSEQLVLCGGSSEEVALGLQGVTNPSGCEESINPEDRSDQISDNSSQEKDIHEKDTSPLTLLMQLSRPKQEKAVGCISQSCAMFETTHDLSSDLQHTILPETPEDGGSRASAGKDLQDISGQISGNSLIFKPATKESSHKAQLQTNEQSVQGFSTVHHHGNMISGPPATESRTAINPDKTSSLVLSQPFPKSVLSFVDFTTMQRENNRDSKQADKDEAAGWSSVGRGSQGAMRRSRKGKRVKRA